MKISSTKSISAGRSILARVVFTILATSALLATSLIPPTQPDQVNASSETAIWKISDFIMDIELTNKNLIRVSETIDTEFFIDKHGIYRAIPYKYSTTDDGLFDRKITLDIDILSVEDGEGNSIPYSKETSGDFLMIKIGDPNAYVSGRNVYKIDYSVKGAIQFYEDHDELYWNATGDQWPVVIEKATTTIVGPSSNTEYETQTRCFTGGYGSTSEECTYTLENRTATFTTNAPLQPNEGLTTVTGYPKGLITPPTFLELYGVLILVNLGVFFPIFTGILALLIWNKFGKDPIGKGTIMPQYYPPEGMTPAIAGVIYDNQVDNHDITATIIDLAIRGYIQIEELPKKTFQSQDYQFHLKNNDFSQLIDHEVKLLEGIFTSLTLDEAVPLSSLKEKYYKTTEVTKTVLYNKTVTDGYFTRNPNQIKAGILSLGIAVLVIGTVLGFMVLLPFGGILSVLGIFVSGLIIIAVSLVMSQRTPKGMEMYEYIKGMKMYIEIAEKDRIDTMQAPDSEYVTDRKAPQWNVELFETLLPYAMIMKVEKKWASKFENIYSEPPNWYTGGNFSTFNTIYFINHISDASSNMNSTFVSQPKSSGSGFSSGGGFSGGGFGGGGGGSW